MGYMEHGGIWDWNIYNMVRLWLGVMAYMGARACSAALATAYHAFIRLLLAGGRVSAAVVNEQRSTYNALA